jgi:hypothetical protein
MSNSKAQDYLELIVHHMWGKCPENSTYKQADNGEFTIITHNKFFARNSEEKKALERAFRYLFEGNAHAYIRRIVIGEPPEELLC